jgi:hypothetical protein
MLNGACRLTEPQVLMLQKCMEKNVSREKRKLCLITDVTTSDGLQIIGKIKLYVLS